MYTSLHHLRTLFDYIFIVIFWWKHFDNKKERHYKKNWIPSWKQKTHLAIGDLARSSREENKMSSMQQWLEMVRDIGLDSRRNGSS